MLWLKNLIRKFYKSIYSIHCATDNYHLFSIQYWSYCSGFGFIRVCFDWRNCWRSVCHFHCAIDNYHLVKSSFDYIMVDFLILEHVLIEEVGQNLPPINLSFSIFILRLIIKFGIVWFWLYYCGFVFIITCFVWENWSGIFINTLTVFIVRMLIIIYRRLLLSILPWLCFSNSMLW